MSIPVFNGMNFIHFQNANLFMFESDFEQDSFSQSPQLQMSDVTAIQAQVGQLDEIARNQQVRKFDTELEKEGLKGDANCKLIEKVQEKVKGIIKRAFNDLQSKKINNDTIEEKTETNELQVFNEINDQLLIIKKIYLENGLLDKNICSKIKNLVKDIYNNEIALFHLKQQANMSEETKEREEKSKVDELAPQSQPARAAADDLDAGIAESLRQIENYAATQANSTFPATVVLLKEVVRHLLDESYQGFSKQVKDAFCEFDPAIIEQRPIIALLFVEYLRNPGQFKLPEIFNSINIEEIQKNKDLKNKLMSLDFIDKYIFQTNETEEGKALHGILKDASMSSRQFNGLMLLIQKEVSYVNVEILVVKLINENHIDRIKNLWNRLPPEMQTKMLKLMKENPNFNEVINDFNVRQQPEREIRGREEGEGVNNVNNEQVRDQLRRIRDLTRGHLGNLRQPAEQVLSDPDLRNILRRFLSPPQQNNVPNNLNIQTNAGNNHQNLYFRFGSLSPALFGNQAPVNPINAPVNPIINLNINHHIDFTRYFDNLRLEPLVEERPGFFRRLGRRITRLCCCFGRRDERS